MKYLRSLSFIQGTWVNFLRTSILFLMLYLIYTRDITVGQFFSLWIYSFFIFGPLQELGNIINIYRETEASLNMFEGILQIPKEPKPVNPLPLQDVRTLDFDRVTFQHQSATSPAVSDITLRRKARRDDCLRRPVGRRQDDARQAAGRTVSARIRAHPLQRHPERRDRSRRAARADRLRDAGHAALLRERSARTCCS